MVIEQSLDQWKQENTDYAKALGNLINNAGQNDPKTLGQLSSIVKRPPYLPILKP